MKTNDFSIVFIGTSSGKTCLNRFHSSLLIKSALFNLLIDCGDGTSKALLSQSIALDSIDGILFSHLHPDHSAGFPSLIVQMKQLKRIKPLKVYCHKNLTETLRRFLHQTFVFMERSGFKFAYYEFEHDEKVIISNGISFLAKQNSHLDEYVSYLDERKSGYASSSFLIKLGEQSVYYSGDIGSKDDLYLFEEQKPEIIITEATHIKLESILRFVEVNKPEKVYLTHLNDDLELELREKIEKLSSNLREKIILASDGNTVTLL